MNEILKKHPYLTGLISSILLVLLIRYVGGTVAELIGNLLFGDGKLFSEIVLIILGAAVLLIFNGYYKKDGFKGVFSFSNANNKMIWVLVALLISKDALVALKSYLTGAADFSLPSLFTFCLALAAAVGEEAMFRAISGAMMMRYNPDKKRIYGAAIITALVFGGFHIMNLTRGAGLVITLAQVIDCAASGFLLAAVYLRTGSILVPMLLHFSTDFFGTMNSNNVTGVMHMPVSTDGYTLVLLFVAVIALAAVYVSIGLYLIRKSKHNEILETWTDKWSN